MKKGAIYLAVILVLLVAVVTVTGYALPERHVATRDTVLPSGPAAVFAVITDVARYPHWRSGVTKAEILQDAPLKWREEAGGDVITFEVVEIRQPNLLRVRIADPNLPFGGTWTYELVPESRGTRLTVTEHGEVYNPVFRFMSRFVFGHTATLDRFIADLKRRVV